MKLNIKDMKIAPEEETFFLLECHEDTPLNGIRKLLKINKSTTLSCNNSFLNYRVDTFGSKVLQSVPLKAITGIFLQFRRDTKFLAAFCCFLATAIALLVTSICIESSGYGLLIMASVCLFMSLICLLIFFLSKTIFLAVQNGSSEFAIKIFCKPTAEINREKFEEGVLLLQNKIQAIQ